MTEQMDEVASDVITAMFTNLGTYLIAGVERDMIAGFKRRIEAVCGEFVVATYDDPMAQGSREFQEAQKKLFYAFEPIAKQAARDRVYNKLYLTFKEVVNDN